MDKQALSFQINDGEIVELSQRDCELMYREEVQPWILLGHASGDEVEIRTCGGRLLRESPSDVSLCQILTPKR